MDADNVVNCLDCCGGVGFVVDERFVGWWRWRHGRRVLVDSAAWPYAPSPVAVASCPVTAVTTMSGLPLRFAIDDACWIAVDPSTDSSMKLLRWWAVDELARTRLGSVA